MDISEAMKMRHSVRRYKTTPLSEEIKSALCEEIESCNREGKLHIQLVTEYLLVDLIFEQFVLVKGMADQQSRVAKIALYIRSVLIDRQPDIWVIA